MKTFRVGFWYTVYGTATHVEAETQEQAEKWVYDELQQNGLAANEINEDMEYNTNDRDYGAQDAEEITENESNN